MRRENAAAIVAIAFSGNRLLSRSNDGIDLVFVELVIFDDTVRIVGPTQGLTGCCPFGNKHGLARLQKVRRRTVFTFERHDLNFPFKQEGMPGLLLPGRKARTTFLFLAWF